MLAYHLVPAIGPARIIRTWAGVTTTVDGRSVLGPAGGVPHLFLAIPSFGGYTLGPFVAQLVADSVMGRKPCEDLAPYSVDRFRPQ
jgi:glycine/D-amino acid oxidase-like deaminating enzyme